MKVPKNITIEPTNICNLSCPLCPRSVMNRPVGAMSFEAFKQIIDDIKPYVHQIETIFLWNHGEPLLCPDIFKMIKYANSTGFKVVISTNCSLLTSGNIINLIDSGISRVKVCLDGINNESYQHYRIGGDFNIAKNGIKKLVTYRNEMNLKYPHITFQFIIMKHNYEQLYQIIKLGLDLGVDDLAPIPVDLGSWHNKKELLNYAEEFLPKNHLLTKYIYSDQSISVREKPDKCQWLTEWSGVILWNGDLCVCCYDPDGKFVSDNVFNSGGYIKLFNSKEYKELRLQLMKNKPEMCKFCHHSTLKLDINDVILSSFP